MNLRCFFSALMMILSFECFAQQAQKPIIMVIPDKDWCVKMGYTDAHGHVDYKKARLNDEVRNVCVEMAAMMSDRGYDLQDFATALDQLGDEEAMDLIAVSKDDAEIMEDEYDQLVRSVNCDIAVNISFTKKPVGPRSQYEYIVKAVDAASAKQKSGFTGVSSVSNVSPSILLKEAVYSYMDKFCSDIQRTFDDIISNGREGDVIFKIASSCPKNMESDVTLNGDTGTLAEVLDYWMNENALDGSYTSGAKSRVRCEFKQVRFPLLGKAKFGGKARGLNMESFLQTNRLDSFLSQFGISCSFKPQGIGKCYVILGGL